VKDFFPRLTFIEFTEVYLLKEVAYGQSNPITPLVHR
jgi:hypothetical protein